MGTFAVTVMAILMAPGAPAHSVAPTANDSAPLPAATSALAAPATSALAAPAVPVSGDDPPTWFAALDSLLRKELARGHIPGAALIGVQDGEIFLSTRGFADLEQGWRVHPYRTRFAVGSVSKVVTAATVLSLVESGRLDLDEDVNRFLPRPLVPEAFGRPLTLRQLLTHTSGLESRSLGLAARDATAARGLEAFLARDLPPRAHPPGRLYVYSQHGYGLAGLAVEAAAGADFATVARERILRPLGMEDSGFEPSALLHRSLATGYVERTYAHEPAPVAFHHLPPAGGLVTTAADLGRLLAALLAGPSREGSGWGAESAGGPLAAASLRTLRTRHYAPHPHPAVEGTALGLFEHRHGPHRALTTRGWTGGHSTYVHLVPELGIGVGLLTNSNESRGLEEALRTRLHERLLDGSAGGDVRTVAAELLEEPGGGPVGASGGALSPPSRADLAGRYRAMTFASRGLEAVGRALLAPQVRVSPRGADGLEVSFGHARHAIAPIAPLLYRTSWHEGRDQHFAFLTDDRGRASHLQWGVITYERVAWYDTARAHRLLLGFFALVFLSGVAVPAARRLFGSPGRRETSLPSRAGHFASAVSGLLLLFLTGVAAHLIGPDRYLLAFGLPPLLQGLLWVPVAAGVATAGMAATLPAVWRAGPTSAALRVHFHLVLAAGVGFLAYLAWLGLLPPL